MSEFGEKLYVIRKEADISLHELAERANLSDSFVGSLEKGRYKPTREAVLALSDALGSRGNELLKTANHLIDDQSASRTANVQSLDGYDLEEILREPISFKGKELSPIQKSKLIRFVNRILNV